MAVIASRHQVVITVIAASCGAPASPPAVPRVRFVNAVPARIVDDRRPVVNRPEVSPSLLELDFFDRSFAGQFFRALSLPQKRRARGVNAVDDVPDSTWFTNRIGIRELSPDEIARGPEQGEGPEAHKPWTIVSNKPAGTQFGLIIRDARGVKYGLSFDVNGWPEMKTGAAIVVNRLVWAFGYNVPDDRIVYLRPEELVVAPDAKIKDTQGRTLHHLDRKEVLRELGLVDKTPDGRFRVMASRWLPGESLGGTPPSGVRRGDVNDVIPHEDRRDLRGQYPLFASLLHLDLHRGNVLDMWVAPPNDPTRRYVMHYLLDFGRALGTGAVIERDLRSNYEYLIDFSEPNPTLGLWPRPWGHHWAPELRGVAPTFTATGYDPGGWKPDIPYAPFDAAERFDMFWGAKVLAHFTRDQIRAAVEAGQFSDPRTVDYLTDTLVARQRATLAYWYARVNPLDRFAPGPLGLCFADLAIEAGLASPAETRYELDSYDRAARPLGRIAIDAVPGGASCTSAVKVATDGDEYTMVKITTERRAFSGSTFVHIARDPGTGAWRVIGVWRI
jgi:hypothetical protein